MAEDLTTRKVVAIQVGTRHRRQLGDLQPLADSMARLGLLHPVVITPEGRLIAGARRLAAAKRLGWTEIPVRVIDVPSLLEAEHNENEVRKEFTLAERARIGLALEEEIAARNAAKMRDAGKQGGRGKKKDTATPIQARNPVEIFHRVSDDQKTRDQVGKAVGMSGRTYEKVRAVLRAAEANPARHEDLIRLVEATGKINKAYETLRVRERLDASPSAQAGPPPPQRIADRLSKDVLEICQVMDFLNDLLKARTEAAMITLVQLSQADLETVDGLFTLTHALTGAWLDEIITLRGDRS